MSRILPACRAVVAVLLVSSAGSAVRAQDAQPRELPLIPRPRSVKWGEGQFTLPAEARIIAASSEVEPLAKRLQSDMRRLTGRALPVAAESDRAGDIVLRLEQVSAERERFRIDVADRIILAGSNRWALGDAVTTLLQLWEIEPEKLRTPRVTITDEPQLKYNGAMLDVARKPHSLETLRRCIDVCRFYKVRYLQLHLTDENAWTFPSTAFPQLGSQNFAWAGGEKPTVYPKEDLQQLVAYAAERNVILVPELEVPGHSGQLRGTLPEIFGYKDAKGKPVPVGVINMTRESAFEALDALIGEVAEIFHTSPYIHLGCDEASLGGLETIPEVNTFLAEKKLPNVEAVFNEFVHRLHAMVVKRGKQIIVWEGAPNAPRPLPKDVLWMPWVGGSTWAGELVSQGYDVINAPWGTEKPYMDPYRVNGSQLKAGEPHLYGATSILWESPEDKAVPYLRFTGALRSEPTRNPTSDHNYEDFLRRWSRTDARLDRLLCGFEFVAENVLPIESTRSPVPLFRGTTALTLSAPFPADQVRFTVDGNEPTQNSARYDKPISLNATSLVQARRFDADGQPAGDVWQQKFRRLTPLAHAAIGAKITIEPDRPGYFGPGAEGLVDGLLAASNNFDQPGWVGWQNFGQPIKIRLDFPAAMPVQNVALHTLRSAGGVFPPREVVVNLSTDGTSFKPAATIANAEGMSQRGWFSADLDGREVRSVELVIQHDRDWTFLDEIVVNGKRDEPTLSHAARNRLATLAHDPVAYTAPGVSGLTDGYVSEEANFLSLEWLGFESKPLEAVIDLGETKPIAAVGGRFLQDLQGGIYIPSRLEVLVSDDGRQFRSVGREDHAATSEAKFIRTWKLPVENIRARYVKMAAQPGGQWLFVDELFVDAAER